MTLVRIREGLPIASFPDELISWTATLSLSLMPMWLRSMTAGFISPHHDGNMLPNDHRTGTRLVQLVVQLVDSQIDLLASLQQREPPLLGNLSEL
jgi:hypothetical protein